MLFTDRKLYQLIIPLLIEQLLAVAVGMTDTVMISFCGEAAVSGVSLVDMINQIILAVFAAVAAGGAVVVSQFLGAGRQEEAEESARQLVLVAAFVSALLACTGFFLCYQILGFCFPAITQDVEEASAIYLKISALSYLFIGVYNACAAVFRAQGDSGTPMRLSLIMNLLNTVGNALTIYWLGWGVAGAALSSLLGRAFACTAAFGILFYARRGISLKGSYRPVFSFIRRILYIGIPGGIESGIFQMGRLFGVSIISGFGTTEIAANAVANNLDALGIMPGQAINLAVITVIGQCTGAGDFKQAEFYTGKLLKICYRFLWGSCACVILFMPLLFRFYDLTADTLALAGKLVLVHDGMAMLVWPLSFMLPNVFRAANDVKIPMLISIASMILIRNCMGFTLAHMLGSGCLGVWIATAFDWSFRSLCFSYRYFSGKWKQYYHP